MTARLTMPYSIMDTARTQRKRAIKEYLENRSGERNSWMERPMLHYWSDKVA